MQEQKKYFSMTRDKSMVAAAVLIGFFAVWFFWTALDLPSICEIISFKDAAAWAQVVGSLIMVGTTVFIFYAGEKRRKIEKEEEKKIDIDEAQLFLLRHRKAFDFLTIYQNLPLSMIRNKKIYNASPDNIFFYPSVFLFYEIDKSGWLSESEFEEFMLLQVQWYVPRLCISHLREYSIIKEKIDGILADKNKQIKRIRHIQESCKGCFDGYAQYEMEQLELELKHLADVLLQQFKRLESEYKSMLSVLYKS